MSIIEHRLSTTIVPDTFLVPDGRNRAWLEDFEGGPVNVGDPSGGANFQVWHLTWDNGTGDFTVTPETSGTPVVVTNATNVTQCSLAFDQNGRPSIGYITNVSEGHLYWYDTLAADFVTTDFVTPTFGLMLQLDDKRYTQQNSSDIVMWYTISDGMGGYHLETREQRDRFGIAYPMRTGVFPYVYKCGMHEGQRGQITMRNSLT